MGISIQRHFHFNISNLLTMPHIDYDIYKFVRVKNGIICKSANLNAACSIHQLMNVKMLALNNVCKCVTIQCSPTREIREIKLPHEEHQKRN